MVAGKRSNNWPQRPQHSIMPPDDEMACEAVRPDRQEGEGDAAEQADPKLKLR
jgi:hypothetical protein